MLLTKEVEIALFGKKIKHYKELGYDIPLYKSRDGMRVKNGTKIMVKIEDMPEGSHVYVDVKCDICGEVDSRRYYSYTDSRKMSNIKYDCCVECRGTKIQDVNMDVYGVTNQFLRPEVQEKSKQTMLDKYGVSHNSQMDGMKEKILKAKFQNDAVVSSKQQRLLCDILNLQHNYVDETTKFYALDGADIENKIDLEYDGSGHRLQVKFKKLSDEEFDKKQIQRDIILSRNGWKIVRIISLKDKLPSDDKIIELFKYAKDYLNTNHSWITFDIDNKKAINKTATFDYDFGVLKKLQ